jgi:hypothetical protein
MKSSLQVGDGIQAAKGKLFSPETTSPMAYSDRVTVHAFYLINIKPFRKP